ncbi:hypothetical protein [Microbacterium esteraromaticum]|uniref:hypothetical protein n=1 Tax=Microbacterium esteraromaticum TaxID=57043 RepID=UPI001959A08B|nr:hypothetical protein [Microbacterium esteraromaticum]MBM7464867.1 hypothetical protein [Microbacterium esteraromaticum]
MSLQTARVQPQPQPQPQRSEPRRRLTPVTAPAAARRPRLAYAALAVGGALAIGAAQMGISLATTQDAFVLADLNIQQHELGLQKQALHENLVGISSPQSLAVKADGMGLVVAGSASYLRLSDGKVLGASDGANWASTVDPNGATKVGNALLAPPPPTAAEKKAAEEAAAKRDEAAAGTVEPAGPPVITDGLPTPTTR